MLEGSANTGNRYGTLDKNLDMGAFRDQEEGGLLLLWRHVAHQAFHDSDERHNAPKCEPPTHADTLSTVMEWARDPEKGEVYLWLYGPKGSGKSALAQTIADWCETEGLLVASFFFSRDSDFSNNQANLGASLIYQFLRFIPEIRPFVINSLEQNPSLLRRSIKTQLEALLVKPLQAAFASQEKHNRVPKVVIIDGLDECADDDQAQIHLLETFAELLSHHFIPVCLRFIIASRPEKHLKDAFYTEPLKSATIHLNIGESANFSRTISHYSPRGKLGARVPNLLPRLASPTSYTHISMLTTRAPPPTPEVRGSTPQTSESSYSPFSMNMDLPSTSSVQSTMPDSISTVTGDTTPSWSSIWRSHSRRTSQTSLDSTKSLPLGGISNHDIATNDLYSLNYGAGSSIRSTRSRGIPVESSPPTFTLPPPMLSPMEPSPPLTLPQPIQSSAISLTYSNPPSVLSPISPVLALSSTALSSAYDRKPVTVESTTPGGLTFEVWQSQARERKPSSSFLGHRFGKRRATPPRADEGKGSILHRAIIRIPELLSYLDPSSLCVLARTCKRLQYQAEKKHYRCVHLLGDALVKPFESAMSKDPRRAHFVVSYNGSLLKGEWLHDAVNMKHLVITRYNNATGFFSTGPFPFHLESFELRNSAPNFYKGQEIANHICRFLETQRSLRSVYIEDNTNYHIFLEQFKPLSANACPQVVAFGGNIFAAEVFFPSRKIVYFQWDKLDQAIPFAGGYEFVFEEFLSRIARPLSRIRALSVSLSDKPDLCLPPTVHAFGSFFPSLRFLEIKNLSDQDWKDMQVLRNLHALYISSDYLASKAFESQQQQVFNLFSSCPALKRVDYSQMDTSNYRGAQQIRHRYYRWFRGHESPIEVLRRMVESERTEFLGEANRGVSLNFSSGPYESNSH